MPNKGFGLLVFFTKYGFLCISCILFCSLNSLGQSKSDTLKKSDTTIHINSINETDTLKIGTDTLRIGDSLTQDDTLKLPASKDGLKSDVNYTFDDSSYFDVEHKEFHLWGKAHVDFEKIKLDAGYIKINFGNNTVTAEPSKDSLGNSYNRPVFNDGDRDYVCDKMSYNFQTKKGKIYGLVTAEGDGLIHGDQVKKDSLDNLYVKNARYSTCTDTLHPHFYILAKRLMIIPGKQIVSGPAQLVVADVPTPIVLPFGFFPIRKGQRRGILPPGFANSIAQGYYLKGLGYYIPINDYVDLAVKADIYFNGSWQGYIAQKYKKNYSFAGNYTLSYGNIIFGDKKADDFRRIRNFNFGWRHTIDPKKIPGYNFNLDINFSSSNFYKTSTAFNYNDITKNIIRSSVNLSKADRKNRYSTTIALNHDQNLQTHDINFTLPEINFAYNSFAPFANKNRIGIPKFYENIRIGYTLNFKNQISTKDTILTQHPDTIASLMRYGMVHRLPLNLFTFKVLKYFNISPTADYTEYWYFKTVEKGWNSINQKLDTFYNNDFKRGYTYSGRLQITTAVYGILNVNRFGLVALSHVIRPSISFEYIPDFSDPKFGFYKYNRRDSLTFYPQKYSIFEQGIYGGPGGVEQGNMKISINNNLEAKYKHKTDTGIEVRKTTLIENLTLYSSYNFLADSFKMSTVGVSGSTKLFKRLAIIFGSTLDPYKYSTTQRVDEYDIDLKKLRLGTVLNARFAVSADISADDFKPKVKTNTTTKKDTSAEQAYITANPDIFANFNIPWTLNLQYTFNYSNNPLAISEQQKTLQPTLMLSGDINITAKWKVGFATGYDFRVKQITFTNINILRDLHCWSMGFDWVPTGQNRRYMFTLKAKSALLQDLKLNKRRDWFDR